MAVSSVSQCFVPGLSDRFPSVNPAGRDTHKPHVCTHFGCCDSPPILFSREENTFSPGIPLKEPSGAVKILLAPIRGYQWVTQNTIWRWLGKLGIDVCLYRRNGWDSCSEYMSKALQELGPVKGLFYGTRRLIGCNPVHAALIQFGWKTALNDPYPLKGNAVGCLKQPEWLKDIDKGIFYPYVKGPLYEKYAPLREPRQAMAASTSQSHLQRLSRYEGLFNPDQRRVAAGFSPA